MTTQFGVAEYYEQVAQQEFADTLAQAGPEVANQPELTATYEISGADGGIYGLRIAGGQLELVPGGIAHSDMHVKSNIDEWRQGASAGMANPFNYYLRRKVAIIKNFRGAVNLDLSNDNGENLEGQIMFGGVDNPTVTVRMNADDYLALMSGRLNGQMAFMTGKLKFDGSMTLLLQVAALNS